MKISDAEWRIMQVVWHHAPVTARDVLEQVEEATGWAYTTVKTMLARLAEKGVLSVRKQGNTSVYQPQVTRSQARREAVRSLLDRAFDGTFGSLLQHMIADEKLSRKDRVRLSQMFAELDESDTQPAKKRS